MIDSFIKPKKICKNIQIFEDTKNRSFLYGFLVSKYSPIIIVSLNISVFLLRMDRFNYYGLPLITTGLIIYFYNKHVMGKTWSIKIEKKDKIITKGLFKYIRHPLYLGILIGLIGGAISTTSIELLFFITFTYTPFIYKRAVIEENLLTKELKDYKEYMNHTGRFLPRLL